MLARLWHHYLQGLAGIHMGSQTAYAQCSPDFVFVFHICASGETHYEHF